MTALAQVRTVSRETFDGIKTKARELGDALRKGDYNDPDEPVELRSFYHNCGDILRHTLGNFEDMHLSPGSKESVIRDAFFAAGMLSLLLPNHEGRSRSHGLAWAHLRVKCEQLSGM